MPDPLTPAQYVFHAGTTCPACRGRTLAQGRYDQADPDTVTRRWGCEACGASWAAVYELTGYEGLTQPTEDDDADV